MSSNRPRLWIEPCCGSAAVAIRLVGGPHANPCIGYQGGKRGYARAILGVLGLRQGQGADEVWLADAGPWAAVWRVLTAPGGADAVAAVIRAWEGEEPRALWERLRAQGWGELTTPEEVGAWAWIRSSTIGDGGLCVAPGACPDGVHPGPEMETIASRVSAVARWLVVAGCSYGGTQLPDPAKLGEGNVDSKGRHWGQEAPPQEWIPGRIHPWPVPVRVWSDARAIPHVLRDVFPESPCPDCADRACGYAVAFAKHAASLGRLPDLPHLGGCEYRSRVFLSALRGAVPDLVGAVGGLRTPGEVVGGVVVPGAVEVAHAHAFGARAMERLAHQGRNAEVEPATSGTRDEPSIPVFVNAATQRPVRVDGSDLPDVRDFVLGGFRDRSPFDHDAPPTCPTIPYGGIYVYTDPPYLNCTGYVHDLPRADVLDLARRWDAAGAVVAISEAVPLDLPGWFHVRIDGERIGQKRTFSRQKDEYLTLNREPAWRPVVGQVALFAPAPVGDSP